MPVPSTASGIGYRRAGVSERLLAAFLCAACLTLLGLAAWMTPSAEGHGTHSQLGLPPCSWVVAFDKPCMTCGMTTAFAHAAEGDLVRSAAVQPFGALLAVLTATMAWGAGHVALTGSRLGSALTRVLNGRVLWVGIAAFLGAWAYKLATWAG